MKIKDYQPDETRKYDLDIPSDLLAVMQYAFARGVMAKREGAAPLKGKEIMTLFRSNCASIHYRRGHIDHVKAAFRAGWQCVELAR